MPYDKKVIANLKKKGVINKKGEVTGKLIVVREE